VAEPRTPPPRVLPRRLEDAAALVLRPMRSLMRVVMGEEPPLDLRLVGRTVLEAIVVGLLVGAAGCLMLLALEFVETLVLEHLLAYPHVRAVGESSAPFLDASGVRLALVMIAPALGGLITGLASRLAPEIRGGGGDAMIEAFHHRGGAIRRRVILLKPLASIATLGSGGAGGREGPTMHLGGALGAWIGTILPATERERRVLMVAGVAAGISAVFRTPLGAALLAIEVLYRDDFESEALIPAVLASVVAYSLSASVLSTAPMFGALPRFPFRWDHLPFYGLTAVVVALAAAAFVKLLATVRRAAARLPGPGWARPALGGLTLGALAVVVFVTVPGWLAVPASHVAALGGGYGAGQLAITGDPAIGVGSAAVLTLVVVAAVRALATALTIGTGGSAGDFAPSLAIGAALGGAVGHAASAWFGVSGVAPGAFALVGMAAFYGGAANVPLAATIMVCEMAGSYDLLVPLMLAQGVAFVALRRVALYPAQVPNQRSSPAHAASWQRHSLATVRAGELLTPDRAVVTLAPGDAADTVLRVMADADHQAVFPVVDATGRLCGLVTGPGTREIAAGDDTRWAVAADLMVAPVTVAQDVGLGEIARALVQHDLRAVPVVDAAGRILGLVDEHDVSRAYAGAIDAGARRAAPPAPADPPP
jgi:CIC family chloride channel protein